jgi:MFS family permease
MAQTRQPHLRAGKTAPAGRADADPRRWKALALLAVVNFMVILDSQIVILALPSVETGLGFSPGGAQWVMSAYLLGFGGLLLLGGRAGDLLGRRRVFLVGTGLFGLASLLCGLAWSSWILIAARAVHGASAALMAPTALAILITTFPRGPERNTALAVWGGFGGLGATAALLIGGTLTSLLGWEWIFFLNVPVAAGLLALAPALLRESRDKARRTRRFDAPGAVTLTAALVLACYAVVQAPAIGWASIQTMGLLAVAAALAVSFYRIEARAAAPLVPLHIFRSRSLNGGNAVTLLIGMAAWGVGLVTSLYAQRVLGYSPVAYGLGTVALTVTAVAGSYTAQAVLRRSSSRVVATAAAVLLSAGALLLAQISAHGSYLDDLLPGLLLFGTGLGAGTVAAASAALANVTGQDAGVASGTSTAAFQLGGALGATVVTTVVVTRTVGGSPAALTVGMRAGFLACAIFAGLALLLAVTLLRRPPAPAAAGAASAEHAGTDPHGAR